MHPEYARSGIVPRGRIFDIVLHCLVGVGSEEVVHRRAQRTALCDVIILGQGLASDNASSTQVLMRVQQHETIVDAPANAENAVGKGDGRSHTCTGGVDGRKVRQRRTKAGMAGRYVKPVGGVESVSLRQRLPVLARHYPAEANAVQIIQAALVVGKFAQIVSALVPRLCAAAVIRLEDQTDRKTDPITLNETAGEFCIFCSGSQRPFPVQPVKSRGTQAIAVAEASSALYVGGRRRRREPQVQLARVLGRNRIGRRIESFRIAQCSELVRYVVGAQRQAVGQPDTVEIMFIACAR